MKHLLIILISISLFSCKDDDDSNLVEPVEVVAGSQYVGTWKYSSLTNPNCLDRIFEVTLLKDGERDLFFVDNLPAALDSNLLIVNQIGTIDFEITFESNIFGNAVYSNGDCPGIVRKEL